MKPGALIPSRTIKRKRERKPLSLTQLFASKFLLKLPFVFYSINFLNALASKWQRWNYLGIITQKFTGIWEWKDSTEDDLPIQFQIHSPEDTWPNIGERKHLLQP